MDCCAVLFVVLEKRKKILVSPNLKGGDILILVQIRLTSALALALTGTVILTCLHNIL